MEISTKVLQLQFVNSKVRNSENMISNCPIKLSQSWPTYYRVDHSDIMVYDREIVTLYACMVERSRYNGDRGIASLT